MHRDTKEDSEPFLSESLPIRALEILMIVAVIAMVVLVFLNVVLRYGFNSGIVISEEVSRFLFIWLIFAGAVVAVKNHEHLGFDSIVLMLPARMRFACGILSNALMQFCSVLLAIGSWKQMLINMDNVSPVAQMPLSWLYFASLAAAASFELIFLRQMIGMFRSGRLR